MFIELSPAKNFRCVREVGRGVYGGERGSLSPNDRADPVAPAATAAPEFEFSRHPAGSRVVAGYVTER